jgi:DNA mismatch repair protein MutL
VNQIAAGEVIERPASVVKELVENAVDAGAGKVSVEISNDCRDIRVADNGSGIHPDDIVLAFSKHATSKIETNEDLFAINTLGFRGEALSSIISIAKLTCTTRTQEFETGTKVKCENSEVTKAETGCAIGTIMEVRDLFYNLPARLKFLRNPNTEFSYIDELIRSLALSHPHVSFELKKNGKTMLKTVAGDNLRQTIKEVYSAETAENLKEVLKTDKLAGFKITGYVSTPDYTRSSKKNYHIYVNSRAVKDPVFIKAVDMAYKNLIGIGKYPFVVLNLEVRPNDIDVNVHPTKKEVRYKNTNQIFNFVYAAVQGGLANYVESTPGSTPPPNPYLSGRDTQSLPSAQSQGEGELLVQSRSFGQDDDTIYVSDAQMKEMSASVPAISGGEPVFQERIFTMPAETAEREGNIIGQYKNTYILIEKDDGLEIVDQHIAEERYIYEKLKTEKEPVSQLLFVSDVVEVSSSDAALIKENIDKFEKFGYGIDFLKDNELIFRKVPQMIAKVSPKEILADILENIDGDIDNLEEKILITTSCKASVKAGQKLSTWQMHEIIKNWRTTKMPYTCPHGRPVTKTIAHKEIAAFFQRTN